MNVESRAPWLALGVLAGVLVIAVAAPLITVHDPESPQLSSRLESPQWAPGADHPLGTDSLGRDIAARLAYGARIVAIVSIVALVLGAAVGTFLGVLAGYLGGLYDSVIMRIVDAALSLPSVLIALLLAVTLGAGIWTVMIAITAVIWSRFARVVRGEALRIRESDYVLLARTHGCSTARILLRHIVPNIGNVVLVVVTLELAHVILLEASLSFLGAGIPPPRPSWGQMIGDGRDLVRIAWWVPIVPGIAIIIVVLAVNRIGDWLRDRLSPTLDMVVKH